MTSTCECQHSRSAHVQVSETWSCQLCSCEKPAEPVKLSVREAARRYAAERGCGREKAVEQLSVADTALLTEVLRSAHAGSGKSLTAFEKLNRQLDVENLAMKLGVDL